MFGGIQETFWDALTFGKAIAEGTAGGITSELSGGNFSDGFKLGIATAGLEWAARRMKEIEVNNSMKNQYTQENASHGYIAGSRPDARFTGSNYSHHWSDDVFGGRQAGSRGRFFFWTYERSPTSWVNKLLETFGGSHEWLDSIHYTSAGLNQNWGWVGEQLFGTYSALAVPAAAVFVGAASAPYLAPMCASKGC